MYIDLYSKSIRDVCYNFGGIVQSITSKCCTHTEYYVLEVYRKQLFWFLFSAYLYYNGVYDLSFAKCTQSPVRQAIYSLNAATRVFAPGIPLAQSVPHDTMPVKRM